MSGDDDLISPLLTSIANLTAQVDSLRAEFAVHVADEKRWHEEAYPNGDLEAHRKDHERMVEDRATQAFVLQSLLDGQTAILSELQTAKAELAQNTQITSAIADAGRTVNTLRKWLLWIGPPVILALGIAVGIWQYQAARGGIAP